MKTEPNDLIAPTPEEQTQWESSTQQFVRVNPEMIGGLTKKEHFAVMAMQGLMPVAESLYGGRLDAVAMDAVHAADALIAALNK